MEIFITSCVSHYLKLDAVIVMHQEFGLNKKDIPVVVHEFLSQKVLVSAMATAKQLLGLSLRSLYPMTDSIIDSQCAWKHSRTNDQPFSTTVPSLATLLAV